MMLRLSFQCVKNVLTSEFVMYPRPMPHQIIMFAFSIKCLGLELIVGAEEVVDT